MSAYGGRPVGQSGRVRRAPGRWVPGVAGEAHDALDLRYQGLRGVAGIDAALGFPAGHVYAPRGSSSRV